MIFLLVGAALVAGTPLIAAVLVSVASVREDAARSLAGLPPGLLARAARRLLQARVGGTGLQERRQLAATSRTDGGPRWQLPRVSRPGPIPEPGWPADDERVARSHDVLATPRG